MKLTLNTKVYYTGDMANQPGEGKVVKVRPQNRFGPETYDIQFDDGRLFKGVFGLSFDAGAGRRFWPLAQWQVEQQIRIEQLKTTF